LALQLLRRSPVSVHFRYLDVTFVVGLDQGISRLWLLVFTHEKMLDLSGIVAIPILDLHGLLFWLRWWFWYPKQKADFGPSSCYGAEFVLSQFARASFLGVIFLRHW
jgi:hypothetical protein